MHQVTVIDSPSGSLISVSAITQRSDTPSKCLPSKWCLPSKCLPSTTTPTSLCRVSDTKKPPSVAATVTWLLCAVTARTRLAGLHTCRPACNARTRTKLFSYDAQTQPGVSNDLMEGWGIEGEQNKKHKTLLLTLETKTIKYREKSLCFFFFFRIIQRYTAVLFTVGSTAEADFDLYFLLYIVNLVSILLL